jgi:hypothetical protein
MTGMSVSDTSGKAIANLGWDEVRMTAPLFVGDTLYARARCWRSARARAGPIRASSRSARRQEPGRQGRQHLQAHRAVWKRGHGPGGRLRHDPGDRTPGLMPARTRAARSTPTRKTRCSTRSTRWVDKESARS